MPELMKNYIDTGKVKFVMREFPIPNLHPRAPAASAAALCARDQGKYWEMHDVLFANQRSMSDEDLEGYAESISLDIDVFRDCLATGKHVAQITSDIEEGKRMGVRGTPSFVVGAVHEDDPNTVKVTQFIRGAQGYASFAKAIDDLLGGAAEQESP
jgi:protein-disulfide isomerase